uniref:Cytochrome c family protein n=1 Tax=Chlorobium chlorochromatii (strain CaD3) TaxID=340177 RepID=Q3AS44_CHLCH
MMRKKVISATVALLATVASFAHAEEDARLIKARALADQLPPKLGAVLKAEIAKSGPEGAISVCRDEAPKIAKELSKESGTRIRRVSLQQRSCKAKPDKWEKAVLEEFDRRAAAGEPLTTLEKGEQVGSKYRYMKALPVQDRCLNCHGSLETMKPAVKAALEQHYPKDKATGYREGQIRGAISVRL